MGLLDAFSKLMGKEGDGGVDYTAIVQWVEQQGGLQKIVESFRQGNMVDVVQSWLGAGENQAITGDHVQQVLSSDAINQLAQKMGIEPSQASSTIAQVLPKLVDASSPNGEIHQADDLTSMLGKLFSK